MAEGAGEADAGQPLAVEDPLHADHRMGPEERHRGLRVLQADVAFLDRLAQDLGQLADVDLQTQLERLLGRQAGADAALPVAGHRLVEAQLAAPEVLAAEAVVAEDLAAVVQELGGMPLDPRVIGDARLLRLDGGILRRGLEALETGSEEGKGADKGKGCKGGSLHAPERSHGSSLLTRNNPQPRSAARTAPVA